MPTATILPAALLGLLLASCAMPARGEAPAAVVSEPPRATVRVELHFAGLEAVPGSPVVAVQADATGGQPPQQAREAEQPSLLAILLGALALAAVGVSITVAVVYGWDWWRDRRRAQAG